MYNIPSVFVQRISQRICTIINVDLNDYVHRVVNNLMEHMPYKLLVGC